MCVLYCIIYRIVVLGKRRGRGSQDAQCVLCRKFTPKNEKISHDIGYGLFMIYLPNTYRQSGHVLFDGALSVFSRGVIIIMGQKNMIYLKCYSNTQHHLHLIIKFVNYNQWRATVVKDVMVFLFAITVDDFFRSVLFYSAYLTGSLLYGPLKCFDAFWSKSTVLYELITTQ